MKNYALVTHTRPITRVLFNRDGDLLFTASRDTQICIWSTASVTLIGGYTEHSGWVCDLDVDFESKVCLSGAADSTAHLWDIKSGEKIMQWQAKSAVRSVSISRDGKLGLLATDSKLGYRSCFMVVSLDKKQETIISPMETDAPALYCRWGYGSVFYVGYQDGQVSSWDAKSMMMLQTTRICDMEITDLQMSWDWTHFIVSSKDKCARVVSLDLEVIKLFETERPVNSAALCPIKNHVMLGGGQDAGAVTTSSSSGKFDLRMFHKVFVQEIARVKDLHFGPINTISVHPDNLMFATGGEEGKVMLCLLDSEYLDFKLNEFD